jgi:hypothetical protein
MAPVARFVALLAFLAFLAPCFAARAEEEAPAGEEPAEEATEERPLRVAETDEARTLLDALKKVARKKNSTDVMPALEALAGVHHESFEKTLLKLVEHESSIVALKAAEMWAGRVNEKTAKKLFSAGWSKVNDKRFPVKGKVLLALAAAGYVLDAKQYKEVERDWRWMLGNPDEAFAPALSDVCGYFERTKDKRHCRWMAEELDDPCANVNAADPNTQPLEWQERRWKMWKPTKPAAVRALKAITGQEFDKVEAARQWFEENEKTFGFKW